MNRQRLAILFTMVLFLSSLPVFGQSDSREEITAKMSALNMYVFEDDNRLKYLEFELENLEGQQVKLSSFEGKVFLLNFWATWCGPCRNEIPSMEKIYKEYNDQGFEIVAVNLQETKEDILKLKKKIDFSFPVLLDSTGEQGGIYGAQSIPTTYIFDKDGYVVAGVVGSFEWDTKEFKEILSLLLNEDLEKP